MEKEKQEKILNDPFFREHYQHRCRRCHKAMTVKRRTKKYCSDNCRVRAYLKRKKRKKRVYGFVFWIWRALTEPYFR